MAERAPWARSGSPGRTRAHLAALLAGALVLQGCAGRRAPAEPFGADDGPELSRVLSHLVWPLASVRRGHVRSPYGYRGWGGAGRYHYGLDLQGRRGEPVHSAGNGVVAYAGSAGAYGRSVRIEHGGGLSSFYAHLDRILVRPGQRVRRGEVLGRVGSSGNATGPHLHLELRWRGRWVNPLAVLPRLE